MKKVGLFLLLLTSVTRADIGINIGGIGINIGGGRDYSVRYLQNETNQLVQVVRYANLDYTIQREVFEFQRAVEYLADCAQFRGRPQGHGGFGVPGHCRDELQQARGQFQQVSYYLNGTQGYYPQVYNQYRQTAQALQNVQVGGPGPGPGPGPQPTYSCVAVDNGWEEHAGGHLGYGRTVYEAQRVALGNCQRVHGSCRIRSCN